MPKVIIPSPLREYADDQFEINLDGDNLAETLETLVSMYPELKPAITGSMFLSVFINGKRIDSGMEGWNSVILNKGDEISLIIPIAGG